VEKLSPNQVLREVLGDVRELCSSIADIHFGGSCPVCAEDPAGCETVAVMATLFPAWFPPSEWGYTDTSDTTEPEAEAEAEEEGDPLEQLVSPEPATVGDDHEDGDVYEIPPVPESVLHPH
jgi:hypothetical protein